MSQTSLLLRSLSSTTTKKQILPAASAGAASWRSASTATTTSATATTTTTDGDHPKLVQVPALPGVGSMIPSYSGIPTFEHKSALHFWPEMRRRFGDFYSFGLPGLGNGASGITHIIQDPHTMAVLLRQEGKHPWGAAQFSWGMHKYFADRDMAVQHFFFQGPEWKRMRSFLQTDLLSPVSSQKYLPAIVVGAQRAAKGAPNYAANLNDYLGYASFDMFGCVMLGESPRITDPEHETDPLDQEFCDSVSRALRSNNKCNNSIVDFILVKKLGLSTKNYRTLEEGWDKAQKLAATKIEALRHKPPSELTEFEANSYTMTALNRASQPDSQLTIDEALTIVKGLISAGVDTTGGTMTWKLLHLALSPHAQERVFAEQVALNGGDPANVAISADSVLPSNAPYLHACIRESHRLANPTILIPQKRFPQSVTVHGVELPPMSVVVLDGYSTGVDPEIVNDDNDAHLDFKPERFLKDAVQARKGTRSEVLDHVFFNGPFSQGARKCPGSRVANLEIAALMAALVCEYEMTVPNMKHWTEVPYDLDTVLTVTLPTIEFTPRRKQ